MAKIWYVGWQKENRAKRAYVEEEREKIARWRLMAMLHLNRDEIHVEPAKTASGFMPFIGVDTGTSPSDWQKFAADLLQRSTVNIAGTSTRQKR